MESAAQATLNFTLPGVAEYFENISEMNSNKRLSNIAKNIKYARNTIYLGFAIAVIAATAGSIVANSNNGTSPAILYTCIAAYALGLGVSLVATKKLYDLSKKFLAPL